MVLFHERKRSLSIYIGRKLFLRCRSIPNIFVGFFGTIADRDRFVPCSSEVLLIWFINRFPACQIQKCENKGQVKNVKCACILYKTQGGTA